MTVRPTSIISGISTPQSLTAVYLNECNLEYELSLAKNESLVSFYIVHSRLKVEALFTIPSNSITTVQEVFIHTCHTFTKENIENLLPLCQNNSIVLVANGDLY